jgi:hypothetical protein
MKASHRVALLVALSCNEDGRSYHFSSRLTDAIHRVSCNLRTRVSHHQSQSNPVALQLRERQSKPTPKTDVQDRGWRDGTAVMHRAQQTVASNRRMHH